MLQCWSDKPELRPDFAQIATSLQAQVDPQFLKVLHILFVQHCHEFIVQNYLVVRKSYEENNLERLDDANRLYETLQGINSKGSIKAAAVHSDYLAMADHFSRQSSKIEDRNTTLYTNNSDLLEMNYVQMELTTSSGGKLS